MKEFEQLFNKLTHKVYYKPYWDMLLKLYVQGDRHYHNLQHIVNGLDEIKEAEHLLNSKELVEFAWWYHDSIYYPGFLEKGIPVVVKDNEEKSAMLACGVAGEIGMFEEFTNSLYELILLTKHNKEPQDVDGKIIVDADLSILGQTEKVFNLYEDAIRREYSFVPEEIFKKERAKILKTFLDRKNIYYTDHFRNKYESQARKNLEFSLFKLGLG